MTDPGPQDLKASPRGAQGGFAQEAAIVASARASARASASVDAATGGSTRNAMADLDAARRVVLWASAGALVVSIGLEWAGWQVLLRHSPDFAATGRTLMGIPVSQWAFGALRNAAGAIGVGLGAAAFSMLWPRAWKHPWRSMSSAFAVGAAATLVLLGVLTAWAP
ncbi:MAG TPA: hypothetical protein PK788_04005 [Gemmatimonadaceae bacterium]|nr:hypothetical protein [Gemmatimonadaceae bacterium]HRQ79410.1 hypothetical protein [Gemmatimonadaceae bacterium]